MDIAARHAIDLTAPGRTPGGTRLRPVEGEPASGTNRSPTLLRADVHRRRT
jgi:hypothetical protein